VITNDHEDTVLEESGCFELEIEGIHIPIYIGKHIFLGFTVWRIVRPMR